MFLLAFIPGILLAESSSTFKVGDLTFERPQKWEQVETTSAMRKAQLKVPGTQAKGDGEVVFFQFPGGAGSADANINRWLGQFTEPRDKLNSKVETVASGKYKVTYVQAEGTYNSGMPGGPRTPMPNYGLLGAIIESDSDAIFVRMTGPKALVKASAGEFKKMIEGALK